MSYSYTCPPKAAVPAKVPAKKIVYRAPATGLFAQPTGTNGSPTSPFGLRRHPITGARKLHNGIDIGNKSGAPVYAAFAGRVTSAHWSTGGGLTLRIAHGRVGAAASVSTARKSVDGQDNLRPERSEPEHAGQA